MSDNLGKPSRQDDHTAVIETSSANAPQEA